ncbi:GDP-mannose-dependent alpha-(1-6)-phosphatidylinositol monomannoside mannosyltransferase [subsurface metagenome]
MPKYYSASDVFIMPSREIGEKDIEGFGLVFLEANACGKPVIGGKSGGISDAVADGVSGILVDPLNVDEISQALITLLSNRELAVKLGSQGRKRVEEQFSYPATAAKFSEAFDSVKLKTR